MSEIPTDLQYSPNHTWLEDNSEGYKRVGITDFAQEELGDIVFVELPEVGRSYAEGEECGLVESVKSASDIFCPISGEIIAVNDAIVDDPEKINQDPYGDGWLFHIKPDDTVDNSEIVNADEYEELIQEDE